ncbi:unnamed protein product [Pleuronectes platessa]|uniref:Secreted protein n=1 Tax=Pleuronectes platessa TaxID=8262 RepID=A0A9N7VFY5_PLEPL|nr:unnamed protein product [Pleuronectes platessa]
MQILTSLARCAVVFLLRFDVLSSLCALIKGIISCRCYREKKSGVLSGPDHTRWRVSNTEDVTANAKCEDTLSAGNERRPKQEERVGRNLAFRKSTNAIPGNFACSVEVHKPAKESAALQMPATNVPPV